MGILSVQHFQMQIHACAVGNRIEKLSHKLRVQAAHTLCLKITCEIQIRPAAQIHSTESQSIVHRKNKRTVSADPLLISPGFCHSLTQHNAGILHRMMPVHI